MNNERGNSTFDIRHIVTSFVSYQLPGLAFCAAADQGLAAELAASPCTADTPLNILAGTNRSLTGENRDRVDVVGDPFAGFVSRDPELARHPVHHQGGIR